MKTTSDFFSVPRFLAYLRVLWAESGKRMLLLILLGFVVLCIFHFTNFFNVARLELYAEQPHLVASRSADFMLGTVLKTSAMVFAILLVITPVLSLPNRGDKGGMQSFLLLPASRFEKYLGSLTFTLVSVLLTCLVCVAADFARLGYISAVYPTLAGYIHPILTDLSVSDGNDGVVLMFCLMGIAFGIAFFRVGRTFFKRWAVLKTMAASTVFSFVLTWMLANGVLDFPSEYNYPRAEAIYPKDEILLWHISILIFVTVLVFEYCVYKRLGENEYR